VNFNAENIQTIPKKSKTLRKTY